MNEFSTPAESQKQNTGRAGLSPQTMTRFHFSNKMKHCISVFRHLFFWLVTGVVAVSAALVRTQDFPSYQLSPSTEDQVLTLDLTEYFNYEDLSGGTLVHIDLNFGNLNIELYNEVAPITVENFLVYLNGGSYTDTFIHRRSLANTGLEVIQGGGFGLSRDEQNNYNDIIPVATNAPIQNEYNTEFPNGRYSMSMAKLGGDPDSATSQWFINLSDNSEVLNENNNGGFTVFAQVIGSSRTVVDNIGGLQVVDATGGNPNNPFGELPVLPTFDGVNVFFDDLVILNSATTMELWPTSNTPGLIEFDSSQISNPDLLTAEISGTTLTLTIPPQMSGSTDLTFLAGDRGNLNNGAIESTISIDIGNRLDTIPGIENDWRYSNWFGLFYATTTGWYFQQLLGWTFMQDLPNDGGFYLYIPNVGWTWSRPESFPALWWFEGNSGQGTWLTFNNQEADRLYFYDWSIPGWVTPGLTPTEGLVPVE